MGGTYRIPQPAQTSSPGGGVLRAHTTSADHISALASPRVTGVSVLPVTGAATPPRTHATAAPLAVIRPEAGSFRNARDIQNRSSTSTAGGITHAGTPPIPVMASSMRNDPDNLRPTMRPEAAASGGRGPAPNPGTSSESRGKITRLVVSSRRGQALPDGGPLRARDTPPLHSGPTARQPQRGAARRQPATPPAREAEPTCLTNGNRIGDQRMASPPEIELSLLTVEEAARRLSIGRTTMYALLKDGQINSVRIGRLRRIPAPALTEYAARLTTEQNVA